MFCPCWLLALGFYVEVNNTKGATMSLTTRIPVAVLGATGIVGQRFIEMLANHPWFVVADVTSSERSAGRRYGDAVRWHLPSTPPSAVFDLPLLAPEATFDSPIAFSALPAHSADDIELRLAAR